MPADEHFGTEEDGDLAEERETGAVTWAVYRDYICATGSWFWAIVSGILLCLIQITNVANSLFLGFWSGNELGLGQNIYMAVYAGKSRWYIYEGALY